MLAGGNALEEYATGRARRELTRLLERVPRVAHRRRGARSRRYRSTMFARATRRRARRRGRCRSTASSRSARRCSTSRRSRASRCRSPALRRRGSQRLRERRRCVRLARDALRRGERLRRRSCGSSATPRRSGRRSCAWPTATPRSSCRSRSASPALPGRFRDAVRFLAVMVVATPCPLILAAPIAFIAGVSRAARTGVIVKGGGVIERLGEARTVLLDKTGTLTLGMPGSSGSSPSTARRRRAASPRGVGRPALRARPRGGARPRRGARGLVLARPHDVEEGRGQGVEGVSTATRRRRQLGVAERSWLRGAEAAARALDGGIDAGRHGSWSASTASSPARS